MHPISFLKKLTLKYPRGEGGLPPLAPGLIVLYSCSNRWNCAAECGSYDSKSMYKQSNSPPFEINIEGRNYISHFHCGNFLH